MSPEGEDLFQEYNEEFANKVVTILSKSDKFVVLGPPASGKSFFVENVLNKKVQGVSVLELRTGFSPEPREKRGGAGGAEAVESSDEKPKMMEKFRNLLRRAKRFTRLNYDELRKAGFDDDEIELLKDHLPEKVPQDLLDELKELRENYGPVIVYEIPYDVRAEGDVAKAVALIREHFDKKKGKLPIRWLGKEYIPPGLIKEVVERVKAEGEEKARSFVKEQAKAYAEVVRLLIGDGDNEFEGSLAQGFKEIVPELGMDVIDKLVGMVPLPDPGTDVAASLGLKALILGVTYASKDRVTVAASLLELREEWRRLSDPLKELVASKVALQLGLTPREAKESIDALLKVDEYELRRVLDELRKSIEELKKRVETLKRNYSIYKKPEDLNFVFEKNQVYLKPVKTVNLKYPFVDPANFSSLKPRVEELKKKIKEIVEEGRGVIVVYGPHGIGKSTLVRYILARLLRDGEIGAVIDLSLKDVNEIRDILKNAEGLNYVALFDPSSVGVYEVSSTKEPMERINPNIVTTIKELSNKYGDLFVTPIPVIVVVPKAVYDSFREEVRRVVESVELSLFDYGFLKETLRSYSGCDLNDHVLNDLASNILKFNEGYTLIAKLVGESLKNMGCNLTVIQQMLRVSKGKAALFLVHWINDYLKIKENSQINVQRVEAFSEILTIKEAFKGKIGSEMYIMSPYLVNRLAYWSSKLGLGVEEDNWGEEANWLALKHEDLLEDALSLIVRAINGEGLEDEELRKALSVWRCYGKKISIKSEDDAVEYIFREFGDRIKEEVAGEDGVLDPNDPCWNAMVFVLGAARERIPVRLLLVIEKVSIRRGKGKLNLIEPIRKAVDYLNSNGSGNECKILKLLLVRKELTPLSRALLSLVRSAEETVDNPFLDVLIHQDKLREDIEKIPREEGRGRGIFEEVYEMGLSALFNYYAEKNRTRQRS